MTTEVLGGANRWKFFLQTSRTFLKKFLEIKPWENQSLETKNVKLTWKNLTNINPMNRFFKKNFCWKIDPYETVTNPMESTQNLSPGIFWHADVESDVRNLPIRHPDLEIKENQL